MIAIQKDDYIIGEYRGKPTLMLVLDEKTKQCVIERTLILDEPEHVKIKEEHVRCNLGQQPLTGKAFGIDIKPYITTIETEKYGPINIFRVLEENELLRIKKALKEVCALYRQKANTFFLPLNAINIEPEKGKYAGSYRFRQKGTEALDAMYLHPKSFLDIEYNKYVIAHEFAHGLWFRSINLNLRSKWLNLYQKRILLSNVTKEELKSICTEIVEYAGSMGDYVKEMGDDRLKLVLREVLSYFKRYHRMDQRTVELMIKENSPKIVDLWPTAAKLTEERPDISEYSLKNVEEFFAEAFANYVLGKKLPKDVQKGIDYTVSRLVNYAYEE